MDMFISHVLDPMTLLGVAMFGVFLYCVKDENRTLTTSESLAANWHLWNGKVSTCDVRYTMCTDVRCAMNAGAGALSGGGG